MAKKKRRRTRRATSKRKQIRTMDVILVVIAIALTAFTIEMILIFRESGTIPDTLCACVFAARGGECGAMAWIRTSKDRKQERRWLQEDQEREKKTTERTDDQ